MSANVYSLLNSLTQHTIQEEDALDLETRIRNLPDAACVDSSEYLDALADAEFAYDKYLEAISRVFNELSKTNEG